MLGRDVAAFTFLRSWFLWGGRADDAELGKDGPMMVQGCMYVKYKQKEGDLKVILIGASVGTEEEKERGDRDHRSNTTITKPLLPPYLSQHKPNT